MSSKTRPKPDACVMSHPSSVDADAETGVTKTLPAVLDLSHQHKTLKHAIVFSSSRNIIMCDFSKYGGKSAEWLQVEATLPVPPEMTTEMLQKTTNETREAASSSRMEELSSQVIVKDYIIRTRDQESIRARTYRPVTASADELLPVYVHFHGGGFFFGTLDTENATCANIAIDVEVLVVNVNYRHTPQHPYPVPYDDSEDAFQWVYEHAGDLGGDQSRIVVGGISAGGALTASLMQTLKRRSPGGQPCVLGQVLMIPLVVYEGCSEPLFRQLREPSRSSYKENEFAPMLPMTRIRMFNGLLHHKPPNSGDRRLNPGLASAKELQSLPPAVFGACGLDPLRDEALLYAKMLHENG